MVVASIAISSMMVALAVEHAEMVWGAESLSCKMEELIV